jgi:hypothetical protein
MMKRLMRCAVLLAAHLFCLMAVAAATPEQIREALGIYVWGNVPDLSVAVDDARSIGADHAIRAFIGPWSDTPPYHDDCRPLTVKLSDAGYRKLIQEYQVIMLTAYDSFSYTREYGEADTPTELMARAATVSAALRPNHGKIENPSLGIVRHLAKISRRESDEYLQHVKQEFSDFAFALGQFNRTFIISNWEAENDVPDIAYWPWFRRYLQARLDGIADGRIRAAKGKLPGRIFTAFEFTIIPGFAGKDSGLERIGMQLGGVDFLSYSAWWSIGSDFDAATMKASFHEAIGRIRAKLEAHQQLIIGEFGEYWNEHENAERQRAIVDTAIDEQVKYLFNWTLYDQPGEHDEHGQDASHFGKFTQARELTPQGEAMKLWFVKKPKAD